MSFTSFDEGYDPVAKFYNDNLAPQFLKNLTPAIEKLLLPHLVNEAHILDVGCGNGYLANYLIMKGHKVTGIDLSQGMLNYAKINAPEAELLIGNAVNLDFLSTTFDGIISTGVLSHIMNIEEVNCVFQNIYKALKKNGIFMLNMFLEEMYQQNWNDNLLFSKSEECVWTAHATHEPIDKIGNINFTIFSLIEDQWKRLDMTFIDRIYTKDEIMSNLKKVGFREISIHDEKHNLKISEMAGSTYFVCYK